jgi:osmoprotectant transport system substrate-binding protein
METLQQLNGQVAVQGLSPQRVAADFLSGLSE